MIEHGNSWASAKIRAAWCISNRHQKVQVVCPLHVNHQRVRVVVHATSHLLHVQEGDIELLHRLWGTQHCFCHRTQQICQIVSSIGQRIGGLDWFLGVKPWLWPNGSRTGGLQSMCCCTRREVPHPGQCKELHVRQLWVWGKIKPPESRRF